LLQTYDQYLNAQFAVWTGGAIL